MHHAVRGMNLTAEPDMTLASDGRQALVRLAARQPRQLLVL